MNVIIKLDTFVYLFFFLISFCKGLSLEFDSKLYLLIYTLGLILACFRLIKLKYQKREIINVGILLVVGMLVFFVSNETTVLFTAIALMFLKNIDIKKLISTLFLSRLMAFILMLVASIIGIIDMNEVSFYRSSIGGFVTRYSFGYSTPNLTHSTFNLIVMMYLYLFFEKINIKTIIVVFFMNIMLYRFTDSRTGFYVLIIIVVLFYFVKKLKKVREKIPTILNVLFLVLILISFLVTYMYGKVNWVYNLDELLTGRIRYMSITFNNYQPGLINKNDYSRIIFDNGFFDLIYKSGILAFIWFVVVQIKTNNYIKSNKLYKEAILTCAFFIYSFFESYYASSIMNISLIFFMYVLFSQKNKMGEVKSEKSIDNNSSL